MRTREDMRVHTRVEMRASTRVHTRVHTRASACAHACKRVRPLKRIGAVTYLASYSFTSSCNFISWATCVGRSILDYMAFELLAHAPMAAVMYLHIPIESYHTRRALLVSADRQVHMYVV